MVSNKFLLVRRVYISSQFFCFIGSTRRSASLRKACPDPPMRKRERSWEERNCTFHLPCYSVLGEWDQILPSIFFSVKCSVFAVAHREKHPALFGGMAAAVLSKSRTGGGGQRQDRRTSPSSLGKSIHETSLESGFKMVNSSDRQKKFSLRHFILILLHLSLILFSLTGKKAYSRNQPSPLVWKDKD